MIWVVSNTIFSVVVGLIIAYALGRIPHWFTPPERFGLGLLGAGCILTIGPIVAPYPTPFEDWSVTLFRVGFAIYFLGRLTKHYQANATMRRQARRHKAGKGL